jgi:ribosome biogenesis protein MAK21
MRARASLSDRFYRALYDKLLAPELRTSSKHAMFLNLCFKAMRHDNMAARVAAFAKRLLQVRVFVCDASCVRCEILVPVSMGF